MEPVGYLKIHRKMMHSSFYKNPHLTHLWMYILMSARFTPKKDLFKGEEIILQPGQFITGRKKIAFETGLKENSIQGWLKKLEKFGMIKQQTTNANRLITVVSWDKYQIDKHPSNNDTTTTQHPSNNDTTTTQHYNKEGKEIKNKKREEYNTLQAVNSHETENLEIPDTVLNQIAEDYNQTFKGFNLSINNQDWNFQNIAKLRIAEGVTIEDFKTVHIQAAQDYGNDRMKNMLKFGVLYRDTTIKTLLENSRIVVPEKENSDYISFGD